MVMFLLMVLSILFSLSLSWDSTYERWDFDDFPDLCKRKMKRTEKDLEWINTPHFGGVPNDSQVWM